MNDCSDRFGSLLLLHGFKPMGTFNLSMILYHMGGQIMSGNQEIKINLGLASSREMLSQYDCLLLVTLEIFKKVKTEESAMGATRMITA